MTEHILAETERLEALVAELKRRQRRNFRVSIGVLIFNALMLGFWISAAVR